MFKRCGRIALHILRFWHALSRPCSFEVHSSAVTAPYISGLVQTPKNLDVPKGGIGSSVLFAEDSTLGPEPLLWASPKRFGDPANTKVCQSPKPI